MSTFQLVSSPIDPFALSRRVADRSSGGFVSFEGWVRDHHEGRAVDHLEYQAYAALCLSAGADLVQQAIAKFGLRQALAVHRTGRLEIGEIAVWVGVSCDHRGEAFRACEWIIDSIKHDLPIWKNEFYPDGTSQWVRCHACSKAAA